MQDTLTRAIIEGIEVRFAYARLTNTVNSAILAHDCDPPAAHLLSRALGAAVLSVPMLTGDERHTLRWHYEGEAKSIVVDVDANANARGFIAPTTLGDAVESEADIYGESGRVIVVKSSPSGVLTSGTVEACLLDVVEDLAYFFAVSHQIETALAVLVSFSRHPERPAALCQGVMLQALPGCDLLRFERIRQRLQTGDARGLLASPPGNRHAQCIADSLIAPEMAVTTLSALTTVHPRFQCRCDRDHMLSVIHALPPAEIAKAGQERQDLRVTCHFCRRVYAFSASELKA